MEPRIYFDFSLNIIPLRNKNWNSPFQQESIETNMKKQAL